MAIQALLLLSTTPPASSLPPKPVNFTNSPPPLSISKYSNKNKLLLIRRHTTTATITQSLLILTNSTLSAPNAIALSKDQIITSITKVEDAVEIAGGVVGTAIGVSRELVDGIFRVVKPGVDASLPIMQKAGGEAVKVVAPVVSEALESALRNVGVDPEPVQFAAKAILDTAGSAAQQTTIVLEQAKPIASTTVEILASSDPITILTAGGALFLAYFLVPPIWSAISFELRGYKGDLSAAQTLDLVSSQDHLLIDIRPEKDKNRAGVPQLPSSAKNKIISIPLEELPSKVRSIIRNSKKVEAEVAALKIAYLKKVNKGSNIVVMDSYNDVAKVVARSLTNLGFNNCWVVADGFSGGRGWSQSRLGTDSYAVSIAEVLSPSRVIPAATQSLRQTRRLLPGGVDE